jgi:hypothetical protein
MGVNHYLGTFDSEWDAAAIYAWAHLLLYGEEATKVAQKEGEEAAAAYEQEKRDIASGKLSEPTLKIEKKKKSSIRKQKEKITNDGDEIMDPTDKPESKTEIDSIVAEVTMSGGAVLDDSTGNKKRKKPLRQEKVSIDKEARSVLAKQSTMEKGMMAKILARAVSKVPMLAPRAEFIHLSDSDVLGIVGRKLKMSRTALYSGIGTIPDVEEYARPCIPLGGSVAPSLSSNKAMVGCAMLIGLSASAVEWDIQTFFEQQLHSKLCSEQDSMAALQLLAVEYDEDGINENFQCLVQGTICMIGYAGKMTQEMYHLLGLGSVPIAGSVGNLDCHIGGVPCSCSEQAACIQYVPDDTSSGNFQLSCLSTDDVVTLNGLRVTPESGSVDIFHEDICSVGARVFAFVLPNDKQGTKS